MVSLHAQSDPSFRLKPANELRSFSVKDTGCSTGTCPLRNNSPICPNGRCIATRSYSSMSPYLTEMKESLGAIERIPNYKDFAQLERAAVQLRDIIWRTEHQGSISGTTPSRFQLSVTPQLALQFPGAGDRPPVPRDSSQPVQHGLSPLRPIVSLGQGSTVSLGGKDAQMLSCALNTP